MLKKNLTLKDLEDLGITSAGSSIRPHHFLITLEGKQHQVSLFEPYTLEQVLNLVFYVGHNEGVEAGRASLQKELKGLLNIKDNYA